MADPLFVRLARRDLSTVRGASTLGINARYEASAVFGISRGSCLSRINRGGAHKHSTSTRVRTETKSERFDQQLLSFRDRAPTGRTSSFRDTISKEQSFMNEVLFLIGMIHSCPRSKTVPRTRTAKVATCRRSLHSKEEQQVKQHNEYPFYA
jgi:hypothetical protein